MHQAMACYAVQPLGLMLPCTCLNAPCLLTPLQVAFLEDDLAQQCALYRMPWNCRLFLAGMVAGAERVTLSLLAIVDLLKNLRKLCNCLHVQVRQARLGSWYDMQHVRRGLALHGSKAVKILSVQHQ